VRPVRGTYALDVTRDARAGIWSFAAGLLCGVLAVAILGMQPYSAVRLCLAFLSGVVMAAFVAGMFDDGSSSRIVRFSAALTGTWLLPVLALGVDWS
jgi:hypothetical protein